PTSPDRGRPDRSRAKDAENPSSWRGGPWGYSEDATDDLRQYHRIAASQTRREGESRNGVNRRTAPFLRPACDLFGRCCRAVRPEGPEHHFRSCVALTGGVEAFAGITGTYSKRSPWQRDDMARSSKPRPRRARLSPARRCSRS